MSITHSRALVQRVISCPKFHLGHVRSRVTVPPSTPPTPHCSASAPTAHCSPGPQPPPTISVATMSLSATPLFPTSPFGCPPILPSPTPSCIWAPATSAPTPHTTSMSALSAMPRASMTATALGSPPLPSPLSRHAACLPTSPLHRCLQAASWCVGTPIPRSRRTITIMPPPPRRAPTTSMWPPSAALSLSTLSSSPASHPTLPITSISSTNAVSM